MSKPFKIYRILEYDYDRSTFPKIRKLPIEIIGHPCASTKSLIFLTHRTFQCCKVDSIQLRQRFWDKMSQCYRWNGIRLADSWLISKWFQEMIWFKSRQGADGNSSSVRTLIVVLQAWSSSRLTQWQNECLAKRQSNIFPLPSVYEFGNLPLQIIGQSCSDHLSWEYEVAGDFNKDEYCDMKSNIFWLQD